jgi:hypothetical protein
VFFLARLVVESVFVGAIPAWVLLAVDNYLLRLFLAAVIAAPVYSYLKMATFKFFLVMYRPYPLVYEEYRGYYQALEKGEPPA